MPKPDIDLLDVSTLKWKPIPKGSGLWEKVLCVDDVTGSHTRLFKADPGYAGDVAYAHDFWEETYTIEGSLFDIGLNKWLQKGNYSCVPPGKKHGPYKSPTGCVCLEFRYYD